MFRRILYCTIMLVALLALALPGLLPIKASPPEEVQLQALTGPSVGGVEIFPANNIWNTRIDNLPVDPRSDAYVSSIGRDAGLHPEFGSGLWDGGPIGIPYKVVSADQKRVGVTFKYADESDPGPYPIPKNVPIEGGPDSTGDRHVLVIQQGESKLYEMYDAWPRAKGKWQAGSGAVYDLKSNNLRPDGWTSADAAGLPVFPGLVRYAEVDGGEIRHALRFTAQRTQRKYVWPARHYASTITDTNVPPMGQRFRLKASFDVSPYPPHVQVVLNALKKYGMILADNGGDWFITGVPDERWDNDLMHLLTEVKGYNFEAVDVSSLMVHPDSGEARVLSSPDPSPTPTPVDDKSPSIAGCPVLPANNIWNTPVDDMPLSSRSDAYVASIGRDYNLHPEFGSGLWDGGPIGLPYAIVSTDQPRVRVSFRWPEESDPGPYPIPRDVPIEGGPDATGDRHILIIQQGDCKLYEVHQSHPQSDGSWTGDLGAVFDLRSNSLRPNTWGSADAAGLPIFPGLIRYDEVAAGEIRHAIRFTARRTQRKYVWPARHYASTITDTNVPPMGQRFRLKASFDVSRYPREVQVILNALKKYGMILADNGGDWFLTGVPDERWDNDIMGLLKTVKGYNFEAVDVSSLMVHPDSGEARTR